MYNTVELIGEVVTIKISSGIEILATLLSVDDELKYLTVSHPRNLVINSENGELALVPYVFTSAADEIVMNANDVLSVSKTADESKEDYLDLINRTETETEEEDIVISESVIEEKSDK